MKPPVRLFAVLLMLALCYLLIWPADSMAEYASVGDIREETKDGWHETYEAHGRTITVDIPVNVPEVDFFPVLRVNKAPAVPKQQLDGYEPVLNDEGYFVARKLPAYDVSPKHAEFAWFKTLTVLSPEEVDWDRRLMEENELTARQALGIFQKALTRFFGKEWQESLHLESVWVRGCQYEYFRETKSFGEPLTKLGSYEFYFVQKMKGIPVVVDTFGISPSRDGERHPPNIRSEADVFSEDYFTLYVSLVNIVDEPYPDVPLLSFQRVKAAYEKLILAGRLREVSSLKLGYMLYVDPVEEDIFWAVPVWVLDGIVYNNAKEEAPPPPEPGMDTRPTKREVLLAQHGTIVSGYNKSLSRYYVPDVLAWEDVK